MSDDGPAVTLATGAGSGIGLAIARRLAREDEVLVLLDRSDSVRAVAEELRDSTHETAAVVVDVADPEDLSSALKSVEKTYGRCDVLVNNAGINTRTDDGLAIAVEDTSLELWEKVMAVNLTGPFLTSRWAAPLMKAQGYGRIVNISSMSARLYVPEVGAYYTASKAGLVGLTRTLAGELGSFGVTANCVAPGKTDAPLYHAGKRQNETAGIAAIPVRRLGQPEEMAATVEFLASRDAGFVNGAVVDVNGGVFG